MLCGCHAKTPPSDRALDSAETTTGPSAEAGYAVSPQVLGAIDRANGAVILTGRAAPGATVRLSAPEGEVLEARAAPTGVWRLRLPAMAAPRMFALSAWMGRRVVHGEGAVLLTPRPAPIALLARAGSGALIIGGSTGRPTISAADCDPGGFCALSGLARPGAAVRLSLDGAPAGAGQADPAGRYAVLAASRRLAPGPHLATVQTPDGEVRRRFGVAVPDPLRSPYQAAAMPDGWRVEWATPGGGLQTTLVFGPP